MSSGISGARQEVGDDRSVAAGAIPSQRTAADAYRVSEDQLHRARMVVARNCDVPADVLQDVLARDVPAAYVVTAAPALAVSEPVTITVP